MSTDRVSGRGNKRAFAAFSCWKGIFNKKFLHENKAEETTKQKEENKKIVQTFSYKRKQWRPPSKKNKKIIKFRFREIT
jgi:hypothetical protein